MVRRPLGRFDPRTAGTRTPVTRRIPFLLVTVLLAALTALPACDGPSGPELPAVSRVRISPPTAVLDPGDTVRLTATALDEDGRPIPETAGLLSWRTDDAAVTVDSTGLVTAVAYGRTAVEAESWDGSAGRTDVAVSPVTALAPDTGRWGAVVTVAGDAIPSNAAVFFSSADGEPVPAFTKSAAAGELEVWVPAGAVTGPLTVCWGTDSATTRRAFGVTAQADVLAGGAAVSFPYRNPSLMANGEAPHEIAFTLPEAGPFTLELYDRAMRNANTTVRAWLFRTDVDPSVLVSFVMTREPAATNAVLDSVAYSRASLPAGEYTVMVAPMRLDAPDSTAVTRAFGLGLEAAQRTGRPADAREPNDFPAEAPTVQLPFTGGGLGFETPFAMDHYAFELADTATVTVTTRASDALVLTYLVPGHVTDILEAWENDAVLAAAEGQDTVQTVAATLPPGVYTALVWDWGGRTRAYSLEVTAGATAPMVRQAGVSAMTAVPAGAASIGARPPASVRTRPRARQPAPDPGPRRQP